MTKDTNKSEKPDGHQSKEERQEERDLETIKKIRESIIKTGIAAASIIILALLLYYLFFSPDTNTKPPLVEEDKQPKDSLPIENKEENNNNINNDSLNNNKNEGFEDNLLPELTPEQMTLRYENIQFFEQSLALRSNDNLEVIYPKHYQIYSKLAFNVNYSVQGDIMVSIYDSTTAYQAIKENLELVQERSNVYLSDTLDLSTGTYYYKLQRVDKKVLKIGKFYINKN